MSEKPAQERTEAPTPKRLQDARKKGQVPRSRELNTLAVMATAAVGFMALGDWMIAGLTSLLRQGLQAADGHALVGVEAVAPLARIGLDALVLLLPLFGLLLLAALGGPALMGGLIFSGEAARPKLDRLNPLAGFKRIFSARGGMELLKTLLKFLVLTGIGALMLWQLTDEVLRLGLGGTQAGLRDAARLVSLTFFVMVGGLVLIALVDVPFQAWNHAKELRMTRQEIKEERKETEGSPEIKARQRRTHYERAYGRMMQAVPDADVVITNPTHYAVALCYGDRQERAPRVVAKGTGLVAVRIRELATEHGVVTCSAPPLARALYFSTEIGAEIPASLYLAVARVLAWVYQLRRSGAPAAPGIEPPLELPVPEALADPGGRR